MGRQGKLHSSPYQVESISYMMAIEKENSDIPQLRENRVNCSYYDKKKKYCLMWNSGVQKCAMYKCRFIKKIDRRKANCEDCAYLYEKICCHPKRIKKEPVAKNEAEYCYFYIDRADNYEKFERLRFYSSLSVYSNAITDLDKKYSALKKRLENRYHRLKIDELNESAREKRIKELQTIKEQIQNVQEKRNEVYLKMKSIETGKHLSTISISCMQCRCIFEWTGGERAYYYLHRFYRPLYCPQCRKRRKTERKTNRQNTRHNS